MPRLAGFSLVALVILAGWFLMSHPWVGTAQPPAAQARGEVFASDRGPNAPPAPVPFDAKRAMSYLDELCKIGPRISGTEGMKKQQEMLEKHFKALGGTLTWQRFSAKQLSAEGPVDMANLVVSYQPSKARRVILCSHYDTRPIADQEMDPRRWREPFLSANDGGSGVALLMELANHLKDLDTAVGIDLVFFDGEEYVFNRQDEYFFGSKFFARDFQAKRGRPVYLGAVLLDMVGGKGARFPIEQNSLWKAGPLVREVWGTAQEQRCEAFLANELSKVPVEDDHIALNRAGIPAVDVIDFDYAHWHRLSDLPENCSGESLAQVARVLSVWVQKVR